MYNSVLLAIIVLECAIVYILVMTFIVCNCATVHILHTLIVHNIVMLFCSALMLHKWFDIYILCCCNSLHRQMVPMVSEHADSPPTHTLIHILNVSLQAILFQTPPPSHMHTHIYTQYKPVCNQAGQA